MSLLAPESREAEIKAFVDKLRKIIDFAQKKMESDQKLN